MNPLEDRASSGFAGRVAASRLLAAALCAAAPLSAAEPIPAPADTVERRVVNDGQVVLEGVPEIPERVRETVDRYLEARSAGFADWTEDGSGIYVSTRFGNVSQLHRVAMPGGARRQLTFFEEPAFGADRRPGGHELLFSRDVGGSEFFQLFLLDAGAGEVRRLTDGRSRNQAALWSEDGSRIAFTSTRRNGRDLDVWVMPVADTAAARLAVEASGGAWFAATDWSADGRKLLVGEYVSITDSRVHLVDLETGERRRLAGGDAEPAAWLGIAPTFHPDGQGAFVSTDAGGLFTRLAYLPLDGGEPRVLTGAIPWNVESFALSDDGRRAAFAVNEGGISRLYLMDPTDFSYAPVEAVPQGILGGLEFSPDGSKLGFTLNRPTSPADAYSLELGRRPTEAGRLVRWTFSEVGGLDPDRFVEPELIEYPTFDSVDGSPRRIPAFVYRGRGPGPRPVIVDIHGGPESQERPGFSSVTQLWANELGATVIAPNVRGSAGYGRDYVALDDGRLREHSVRDIGALLDWIARQPELDESRVAVIGGSYGGYMVLASLVHYSDRLAAGVEIVGISNFVTFLENTQDYRRDLRRAEYGDERDPEMRAFLESVSPANHAERITAPLLVGQGANDPRVPASESEQIVEAVRSSGYDVWYALARNEGHGFRRLENRKLWSRIVFLFLERHLSGGDAGG